MRFKWTILLLLFWPWNVYAFGLSDFFFESSVMKMRIEYEDLDTRYDPVLIRGKSGYMINSNAAVELQIGGTVKPDDSDGSDVSAYLLALNVRYGAPKNANSTSMYLSTGVSTTRIAVENGSFENYDDFNNLSAGFGLEERFSSIKNAKITLEFTKYFAEDDGDPDLTAISLGLRTDF